MAKYRAKNRLDALIAYSGPTPICACPGCHESRLPFLTIDHIDGGGNTHRAALARTHDFHGGKVNPGGGAFYRWLKKEKFPTGYRVLCFNCNMARGTGHCPVHEISSDTQHPHVPTISTEETKP